MTPRPNPYWSPIVHDFHPYIPGEQPRGSDLVKLNTNESPYGPSPNVLAAIQAELTDSLRLYPDPDATALRHALARYHGVQPNQVFVGNGSDEVLAHTFAALLKHDLPLLTPDITYGLYPAYCRRPAVPGQLRLRPPPRTPRRHPRRQAPSRLRPGPPLRQTPDRRTPPDHRRHTQGHGPPARSPGLD